MTTILLADDNPHVQRMGREILSQEGYEVVTVADGHQAMQYLAQNRPAAVLADVSMPGPNGYEIYRWIRSNPELADTKIVLLHGPLEPFDAAKAAGAEPDGVLQKPLDAGALIQAIRSLAGNAEPRPADSGIRTEARPHAGTAETKAAPAAPAAPRNEAPTPAVEAMNPFAALVEQALQADRDEAQQRARIRAAVGEVLEEMQPSLTDQITERVLRALRQD